MKRRWRRSAIARAAVGLGLVFALVTTLACAGTSEADRAKRLAADYFASLLSGQQDFGYAYLHPGSQDSWPYPEYESDVLAADWTRFSVRVTGGIHCDDRVGCFVCLHIPGGIDSVPTFLRATENRATDGILFPDKPEECGNAEVGSSSLQSRDNQWGYNSQAIEP